MRITTLLWQYQAKLTETADKLKYHYILRVESGEGGIEPGTATGYATFEEFRHKDEGINNGMGTGEIDILSENERPTFAQSNGSTQSISELKEEADRVALLASAAARKIRLMSAALVPVILYVMFGTNTSCIYCFLSVDEYSL